MIYLYNTLSRKKEEFVPLEKGKVKMYTCGLTVNNYAHIGHGVAYIMMDLLVKMFKLNGYDVFNVMNITDVGHLTSDEDDGDDKIALASKREGVDAYKIAQYYTDYFLGFLTKLNIAMPKVVAKATEHINEMIEFVKGLDAKGYVYKTDDGLYYDISKFKDYGKLSGKKLEDLKAGARIEVNKQKKSPYDFALWKFVSPNTLMKWESPFGGFGCPGWHIECSAMSHKYLGETYDIHTGGVDHIPVHHENEIAQSEGFYGHKTVNYWMHCEFLKVDGQKMSKSLGNCYTLEQLSERGFDPLDFRFLCMSASYRKQLNFTFEALEGARKGRLRLYENAKEHFCGSEKIAKEKIDALKQEFLDAVSDDLGTCEAIGKIWTNLKTLPKSRDVYEYLLWCDQVLSLDIEQNVQKLLNQKPKDEIPQNVVDLAQKRLQAKKDKNYAFADELRNQISALGFAVVDTKDGFEVKKI